MAASRFVLSFLLSSFVASCPAGPPSNSGQYLYCKHCGAPLIACDELEHIPSPIARRTLSSDVCGEHVQANVLPHTIGGLRLLVHTPLSREIEATGASFIHAPSVYDASGWLRTASPIDACTPLTLNAAGQNSMGALLVAKRGNCTFHTKALNAQGAGAVGLVVVDTESGPVAGFAMSGPEPQQAGVSIPVGIVAREEALPLFQLGRESPAVRASLVGVERLVLTARASTSGLALERSLPLGQSGASWFPDCSFRQSKCRVCGVHVGYFFNRSSARGHGGAQPATFHALLRDDVADLGGLRSMAAKLWVESVL